MVVGVKESNFLCHIIRTFEFCADICSEEQFLFHVGCRRAMKDESVLRLRYSGKSVSPFVLLGIHWNCVRTKIKIKPIVDLVCDSVPYTLPNTRIMVVHKSPFSFSAQNSKASESFSTAHAI